MPSCLGLYIEDNLIKYAKVSKNNEALKVESFGVKFYEKIGPAIKQIVEETYSFKTPISVNSTDEWYNEMQVFSLLSKKDMDNTIKTEFENICYLKEVNKNIYEEKYILSKSFESNEKTKVIHMAVPKTLIEQRKNQFLDYRINNISPISVSISNLLRKDNKGTQLIVNIEKDTTITTITNGVITDIEILGIGAKEILENINQKENSYNKAYEICKRATIYTETDKDLQYEDNEYLEDIMPTLFKIVSQIRKKIDESIANIDKIYITGTGSLVNNIDIYFQDYLKDIQCEILKPSFLNNNSKINMKDYIEVNSAIAMALQGIEKSNEVNFKEASGFEKIMTILTTDAFDKKALKKLGIFNPLNDFLNKFSTQFNTLSTTFIMLVVLYAVGVILVDGKMNEKIATANESIKNTNQKIEQIQEYNRKFNSQISKYNSLITNIQDLNDANSQDKRYRNTIPNLLNNIMATIPRGVQLVSIKNASDTHIVISAKSVSYEEVAYFKAKLKTEGILENVVSDTGVLTDGYLNVVIEGELP